MTTAHSIPVELIRLARRGQRSEARAKTLARLFRQVMYSATMVAVRGWALMLAVGVVHGWWPAVPPLGFWSAVVLTLLVPLSLAPVPRMPTKDGAR